MSERDFWRDVDAHIAEWMARNARATGITPNTPLGSVVFDRFGRAVSGASSALLIAYASRATNLTRAAGTFARIDLDDVIYDPQGTIATGVSWRFTPPANGQYAFTLYSEIVPSAALAAGEKLYWQLWPDATGIDIHGFGELDIGITETGTRDLVVITCRRVRACTTSDAVNFRFGNGTANSVVLNSDTVATGATSVAIERVA